MGFKCAVLKSRHSSKTSKLECLRAKMLNRYGEMRLLCWKLSGF